MRSINRRFCECEWVGDHHDYPGQASLPEVVPEIVEINDEHPEEPEQEEAFPVQRGVPAGGPQLPRPAPLAYILHDRHICGLPKIPLSTGYEKTVTLHYIECTMQSCPPHFVKRLHELVGFCHWPKRKDSRQDTYRCDLCPSRRMLYSQYVKHYLLEHDFFKDLVGDAWLEILRGCVMTERQAYALFHRLVQD